MFNAHSNLREFDNFLVDVDKKVLWHANEPVALPVKAVEVLCELVERPGEIVTKDELLERVWHDSFVEENVLAQSIHHLRKAFKDLGENCTRIQTIPRRGYRLTGELRGANTHPEVLIEHELVERDYFTSEDSIREPDPADRRSAVPAAIKRILVLASVLASVGILLGVTVWQLSEPSAATVTWNIRSIAVLPLIPIKGTENTETFSLGLTDSLISRLGRLNKFAVRPFSAVEKFGQSGKDAVEFGRQLKADAALEGNVQQMDGRLRVSVRLIDVRDGAQIWSDNFDATETDLLKLQDSISLRVARALLTKLDPKDEKLLAGARTSNPEAYRLYLAGRDRWLQRNWKVESVAFYQKAIELDPDFALPYLGIADEYAFTYETRTAESALAKAIELDPNLAEAHATRGFLQMFHHWDWAGAEASFRRALELAPNSSKAHHWYGVFLSLRGRVDDAVREMEKALELDPTALVIMTDIAELYYFKHDYDRAETELQNVLSLDPDFLNARMNLTKVKFKKGGSFFLEEAAFNVFRQNKLRADARAPEYDTADIEALIAARDEKTLRYNYVKGTLAAGETQPETYLALSRFYAITGENEKSLDALEKACEKRPFIMPFVAVDPMWDPVRDHPRFQKVIHRIDQKF
ncbi:MAG TPA: tetratricopeptide repeat protein [Pyrinomonadaceae bacterium]|nr:tetratricopeptide repeat protein [Pyrinomonadaceae bacterium]